MSAGSCIYAGWVQHTRVAPSRHAFRYPVWWMFLDLDELPQLGQRLKLFSAGRLNLFSLHEKDYGDGQGLLKTVVAARLAKSGIASPIARVKLLTMPRLLGYAFNPLSIYFCYGENERLAALIYEVHNTFGERHSYIASASESDGGIVRNSAEKRFHVSPFMDTTMGYSFRVRPPAEDISVCIAGSKDDVVVIHAVLQGARRALTDRQLIRHLIAYPLVTLKVMAAIHWEAFRLWRKGFAIHPHSAHRGNAVTVGRARRARRPHV